MINLPAHDSISRKIQILEPKLEMIQGELFKHPVFTQLSDRQNLKTFMEYHVFAVWDFMSLLKALQIKLTHCTIPWQPSLYPKELVRFVNSIVMDEESDFDHQNQVCDHFSMYVQAMEEVQANTKDIRNFVLDFNLDGLPNAIRDFVDFNISISRTYPLHVIAGVFCFGREKIIPDIFREILSNLKGSGLAETLPALTHYLNRHIVVDEEDHGPMAEKLLIASCNNSPKLYQEAMSFGIQACLLRKKLFDAALEAIEISVVTQPLSRLDQSQS